MSKDLIQRILDRTDGGLQIILSLVPEAEKCMGNKRHFKLRATEKTASAALKKLPDGRWYVTDFGGDFKGGAINLYMYLEGKDIKTAIKELGARYQCLDDGKPPEDLKPKIEKRPAKETEQPGEYFFEYKKEPSDKDLEALFAKSVIRHSSNMDKENKDWTKHLRSTCTALGFYALTSFTYIKDRQAITTYSTDNYPIFVIEGTDFKKIYQPRSLDKKYRFRYQGNKPADYIFGLQRFSKVFQDGEKRWADDQRNNEEETERVFQLDEVIICSGDRDSLNVAALGYNVIWQNSESAILPIKIFNDLKKKAKAVYNLPDIDSTGHRQGHQLAVTYLELKTIQLPAELTVFKDWRGNPCKDVRDFLDRFEKRDFDKLVKSALEYKFWDEEPQFDKNGKFKRNNYVFNNVRAYNFITRSGFHRIASKTAKSGYEYIQVNKSVVKIIEDSDIKGFVNQFLEDRHTDDQRLRNTFYRSNQLKDDSLVNLKMVDLDFKYYTRDHQYFFFLDKTWKVTATAIEEYRAGDVSKLVWESKVIQHKVKLQGPPFKITKKNNPDGSEDLELEILRTDCLFFRYLINTSRVHWRTELETRCEEKFNTKEEQTQYRKNHQFAIEGELLEPAEKAEQKAHLVNKIFVLGYMLARYKEKSKPWAPFLMDHKLSQEGESHGGSGKTIFARSVEPFMNFLLIDGKSKSLTDDKHAFENVTEQTEIILVDDLSRYLNIETFFSMITEGITVNPKYSQRFVLEYKTAPKVVFTSNFGVKDITPSAERRLIYAAFSDYYHNNSTGLYREERTPAQDFGKDLFTDFTEEEWNNFSNTMAYCLQAYMYIGHRINPPMDNVLKRNLQGIMGDAFLHWADVYFSEENKTLDAFVCRSEAFEDFKRSANAKLASVNKFSLQIEAWCRYYGYICNPEELRNGTGRIVRKWPVKKIDGSYLLEWKTYKNGTKKEVNVRKSADMIYIQTIGGKLDPDKLKETEEDPAAAPPADQDDLPF